MTKSSLKRIWAENIAVERTERVICYKNLKIRLNSEFNDECKVKIFYDKKKSVIDIYLIKKKKE